MINGEAIEKIEELVQAIQEPVTPPASTAKNPTPFVIVPSGWDLQYPRIPEYPSRIAQAVALHSAESFVSYVKVYAEESSVIFVDEDKRAFTAILDYHGGGVGIEEAEAPRWCEHVVTFLARTTPEWDTWSERNRKGFGQVEFAEFLEDNLIDVSDPSGAELLEITRTLEAKKDVAYSSAIRLNNGSVRINYDEQIKGTANTQAGNIDIPEQFTLQLQVIRGGSQFRFPARFKYRLKERALVLWYEIVRPHKILEQAISETLAAIQEGTGLTVRNGVVALPSK